MILSFNEISLTAGLEIANLLLKNKDTLRLLDLNGNKFGDEGKLEIQNTLQPISRYLASLSEDEGSEEEDEERDEDEVDDEDEDEDEYEEYDDDDEDGDEDEDEEEEEGNSKVSNEEQYDIIEKKDLVEQEANSNQFSKLVINSQLITNIEKVDKFLLNPSSDNANLIDDAALNSLTSHAKYDTPYLLRFLATLSKYYDQKLASESNEKILHIASNLRRLF